MKLKTLLTLLGACLLAVTLQSEPLPGVVISPDGRYELGGPRAGLNGWYSNAGTFYGHKRVTLTAAQINGMAAAPVLLVPAQGANKTVVVHRVVFVITRTATAFASGGAVIVQYGSAATGAGTQACDSTIASTVITGAAGTSTSTRNGAVISDDTANVANAGVYLSNQTGAFTTGTGTATIDVWYDTN
jgi:hypothetical protein